MLLIRSQIYNLLMYFFIAIIGTAHLWAAWRSKEGVYRAVHKFSKVNLWLLKNICGITAEVRGPVPTEPCILCAKHMSFLDIVLIADAVPDFKFIMKEEIRYVPIIGFFAKRVGSAPVSRGKSGAMEKMIEDTDKGASVNPEGQLIIFPQGTRVLPEQKLPYKRGAWHLYNHLNLPVYLAATNVGILWGRRSPYRYPGHVVVEFLPERIEPGMALEPFMTLIEEKIERRSNELMAQYPRGYKAEA